MDRRNEDRLDLLVTIFDRGMGNRAVDHFKREHLHFDFICLGHGTANSEILDYLGLGETEKDVVLSLVPHSQAHRIMRDTAEDMSFSRPGKGIIFTVPLSGVSGSVSHVLCKPEYLREAKEDVKMEGLQLSAQYDPILTILNRGYTDQVMDAARSAGAGGGTVLHARRAGFEDAENFLGFTLQPEREIIAILAPRTEKQAIMQAINAAAGLSTEARGILLSLPVDQIMGLRG